MTIFLSDAAAQAAGLAPRGNKFGARRVYYCPVCAVYHPDAARCPVHGRVVGGLPFDSGVESERHATLVLLERAGHIVDLRVHRRWPLVVAGVKVGEYEDDFDYSDGVDLHVEDVKSPITARLETFRMKRALMLVCYRIKVEVILVGK